MKKPAKRNRRKAPEYCKVQVRRSHMDCNYNVDVWEENCGHVMPCAAHREDPKNG